MGLGPSGPPMSGRKRGIKMKDCLKHSKTAGAKLGQFVVANIEFYPTKHRRQAIAHIQSVLGDNLTPGMEMELVLM